MRLGVRATSIDLRARRVTLADGTFADYDRLIIATGARVRTLSGVAPRAGLLVLRGLDDAIALRRELMDAPRVAIVGAGFIGLEVAASCRGGQRVAHRLAADSAEPCVDVLEGLPKVLDRSGFQHSSLTNASHYKDLERHGGCSSAASDLAR
jgi:NADH dehydrogenase FAD-containing subunit